CGAAAADGAAMVAAATPPSNAPTTAPAAFRRAVIPRNFIVSYFLSVAIRSCFPALQYKVAEWRKAQTGLMKPVLRAQKALHIRGVIFASIRRIHLRPTAGFGLGF